MTDVELWIDKAKIQELFSLYTFKFDGHDAEGWADLFLEDGVFEVEGGGGSQKFTGRDILINFARNHFNMAPGTRHIQTSHITDVNGDEAFNRCAMSHVMTTPEKVVVFAAGFYETWLVRREGEWKIKHRIAHADNFENFEQGELADIFGPFNRWCDENCDNPA